MYSYKAVTEFVPDNIVVDTEHRQHVEKELQALGVWPERVEENASLGLTLLGGIRHLQRCANDLRPRLQSLIAEKEAEHGTPGTFSDLDVVLAALRDKLVERGPLPDLGKDRHVATALSIAGGEPQPNSTEGCPGGVHCPVEPNPVVTPNPRPTPPSQALLHGGSGSDSDGDGDGDGGFVGSGVTVGILDTAPDPDAAAASNVRFPWQGHGMFVESLVRRHAPGARIVKATVLRGDSGRTSLWATAAAIAELADRGVSVLHLALSCRTLDGEEPLLLARALGRLGPDVLVVAAAGNDPSGTPDVPAFLPASLPQVVAVGATGASFNPKATWLNCTANGVDEVGTFFDESVPVYLPTRVPGRVAPEEHNGWLAPDAERLATHGASEPTAFTGSAVWSGTSFAAANAAGAIAAELAARGGSPRDALDRLLATGDVVRPVDEDR